MEKNRESLPLDRKVTSRDVARVAGVSQSTVPRVFFRCEQRKTRIERAGISCGEGNWI